MSTPNVIYCWTNGMSISRVGIARLGLGWGGTTKNSGTNTHLDRGANIVKSDTFDNFGAGTPTHFIGLYRPVTHLTFRGWEHDK